MSSGATNAIVIVHPDPERGVICHNPGSISDMRFSSPNFCTTGLLARRRQPYTAAETFSSSSARCWTLGDLSARLTMLLRGRLGGLWIVVLQQDRRASSCPST